MGRQLQWPLLATHREDAIELAATELRTVVKGGARSLERNATLAIEHKSTETERIEAVLDEVRALVDVEEADAFPREFTYERTSRSHAQGFKTVTEEIVLEDADDARTAAAKIARSLKNAGRMQRDMLARMERRRDAFSRVRRETKEAVGAWRGMLREVLMVQRESY